MTRAIGVDRVTKRYRVQLPSGTRAVEALTDVSVAVDAGEVLGVLGANGSGKSTLLRVMAGVTRPDAGAVERRGRVGGVLEVAAGFHPELSGRENLRTMASIWGASQGFEAVLPRITDFSGIGDFLDVPVKRYSTGMYSRLGIAAALHLSPAILLIDETLAVGDVHFQHRCIERVRELARAGRAVVLVTHDVDVMQACCTRAILLRQGRVVTDGAPGDVSRGYLAAGPGGESGNPPAEVTWADAEAPRNDVVQLLGVAVVDARLRPVASADRTCRLGITIRFRVLTGSAVVAAFCAFFGQRGVCLFSSLEPVGERARCAGEYAATVWLPPNLLAGGFVRVSVALGTPRPHPVRHVAVDDAVAFTVTDDSEPEAVPLTGAVRPCLEWSQGDE